jgi:hypothetical protein
MQGRIQTKIQSTPYNINKNPSTSQHCFPKQQMMDTTPKTKTKTKTTRTHLAQPSTQLPTTQMEASSSTQSLMKKK